VKHQLDGKDAANSWASTSSISTSFTIPPSSWLRALFLLVFGRRLDEALKQATASIGFRGREPDWRLEPAIAFAQNSSGETSVSRWDRRLASMLPG